MSKHNKPFEADYAKSGRSQCKNCKNTISQGSLRLAVMVQSPMFDGKTPHWYHEACFWSRHRPKQFLDIHYASSLKLPDQEKIKSMILGNSDITEGKKTKAAKGKKRPNKEIANTCNDFKIQYSLSNRAGCRGCQAKIAKDDIRVSKKNFDSEHGKMFGGVDEWYHLACFAKLRMDLEFPHSGEKIPGFENISDSDQKLIKKMLPDLSSTNDPSSSSKDKVPKEEQDETDGPSQSKKAKTTDSPEYEIQIENLYKALKVVEKMSRKDVESLLESNGVEIPKNIRDLHSLLADHLLYGTVKACPKCSAVGKYEFLPDEGYRCTNIRASKIDESTNIACGFLMRDPDRVHFLIPSEFVKKYAALKDYKHKRGKKLEKKIFHEVSSSSSSSSSLAGSSLILKSEPGTSGIGAPLVERHLPLKDMVFYIHVSAMSSSDAKQKLTKEIINLGGDVVRDVRPYLAAAFGTQVAVNLCLGVEDTRTKGMKAMEEIEELNIHVVPAKFVKDAAKVKPGESAAALLEKMNLAPWASDLDSRIKMAGEEKLKSMEKSKSAYKSKSGGKVKLTIQEGLAVDPDSGLADTCELAKFEDRHLTATMSKTDITTGKNSYYKLQVMKSKVRKNKYHVFRSWGRIGTSIGGKKIQDFSDLHSAMEKFEEVFEKETGNDWHEPFSLKPGKMMLLDVKYDEGATKVEPASLAECSLEPSVQNLVQLIFDKAAMKATLAEYVLDMDKLPLGKLSAEHLNKALRVLGQVIHAIETKEHDMELLAELTTLSNHFYSLIPHDYGLNAPPILACKEMVMHKTQMIDALMQIDIAYTISEAPTSSGVHPLENCYNKLEAEIKRLDPSHEHFSLIQKYVTNTHAQTHRAYELKILDIFDVSRAGEEKRFKPMIKVGNRHLLWHGSRLTNFAGIISKGLCIAPPDAPVTGYMFGKGIYFADSVSKAANYCMTSSEKNVGLLLLCEVVLGKPLQKRRADYVTKLPAGFNSVQGLGRLVPNPEETIVLDKDIKVPLGPLVRTSVDAPDTLALLYNEFIVYDPAQVKIRYLLKVQFNYL